MCLVEATYLHHHNTEKDDREKKFTKFDWGKTKKKRTEQRNRRTVANLIDDIDLSFCFCITLHKQNS